MLSGVLLLMPAPAPAFIIENASGTFGVQQRQPVVRRPGPLQYHGGKVIHASDTYAIYWDPLELYNNEWMRLIDGYFQDVGSASASEPGGDVFALNAQYGETGYSTQPSASAAAKEAHAANQTTFRGAYTATDPYPSGAEACNQVAAIVCLSDQDIKTELQKVINSGALPGTTGTVPGAKSNPVYYLLTPPGVTVCAGTGAGTTTASTCSNSAALELETKEIAEAKIAHPVETGICGYHSTINSAGPAPIAYAVQPWVAGDAGLIVESESPLKTVGTSADVLACQNDVGLQEPNQVAALNPFAFYGVGLADVIIGDLANEQSNTVVNPLMNGWYQNASAEEKGSPEEGDMCQFAFEGGEEPAPNEGATHAGTISDETIGADNYYVHWAFNSSGYLTGKSTKGCWQGNDLQPHITAPNPVNVGDVVALDANESAIAMAAAPLGPRLAKEITRTEEEVKTLQSEEANLTLAITKLGEAETTLKAAIKALGEAETKLEGEIATLASKEAALAAEEKTIAGERKKAKESTLKEEEEFTSREQRVAAERKKVGEEKATAEAEKKTDKEHKVADQATLLADEEKKTTAEHNKSIVNGDVQLAKGEETLAKAKTLKTEPFGAPIYKWDFGYKESGVEVTEEGEEKASVFHVFPCAKTYTVNLTVIDSGGFEASLPSTLTKTITVEGKPCEEAPSGGGGSSGASGGSGGGGAPTGSAQPSAPGTGSTGGAAAKSVPVPGPVATAAISSTSLKSALSKGLSIRYSVSEQVTGHFEVLLAASIAKKIGLKGPLATGLPKGTPPQMVIAKAILVTTRGGRNSVKIQFGKKTAKLLHKLHKVPLMVRLIVHNGLSNSPANTTTAVSVITLTH